MSLSLLLLAWPLCPLVGWLVGSLVKGRPAAGFLWGLFLGPPGWLVVLFLYGGAVRCPNCGRKTPSFPAPRVPSGASFPHLRCRRCGSIV